jgi:hypothetical protein
MSKGNRSTELEVSVYPGSSAALVRNNIASKKRIRIKKRKKNDVWQALRNIAVNLKPRPNNKGCHKR